MRNLLILAALLTGCLCVAAQDKPAPLALTDAEQKEVAAAVLAGRVAESELNQAVQDARRAKLECAEGIASLAKIQLAFAHIEANQGRYQEMLAKHRQAHNCPDCEHGPDGKSLIRPQPRQGARP